MQFLRKYLLREPSQSGIQAYVFYVLKKKIICENYNVHLASKKTGNQI
jgi:hypothetical protein